MQPAHTGWACVLGFALQCTPDQGDSVGTLAMRPDRVSRGPLRRASSFVLKTALCQAHARRTHKQSRLHVRNKVPMHGSHTSREVRARADGGLVWYPGCCAG